jgi:hypothetical protein
VRYLPLLHLLLPLLLSSGCATPTSGTRHDVLVHRRSGEAEIRLDTRAYVDRPFEVTLPAGAHATLTLYELDEGRERLLLIGRGDERLEGTPLRVQLLFPSAEREAPGPGEYLLVVTDGEGRLHEVQFGIVERSLETAP